MTNAVNGADRARWAEPVQRLEQLATRTGEAVVAEQAHALLDVVQRGEPEAVSDALARAAGLAARLRCVAEAAELHRACLDAARRHPVGDERFIGLLWDASWAADVAGRRGEAIALLDEALTEATRRLGTGHPAVAASLQRREALGDLAGPGDGFGDGFGLRRADGPPDALGGR